MIDTPAPLLNYETPATAIAAMETSAYGVRFVRRAVLVLALALTLLFAQSLSFEFHFRTWDDGAALSLLFAGVAGIVLLTGLNWWLLPLILRGIFRFAHAVASPKISCEFWIHASFNALWPLPWAAAAAGALLVAYYRFHLGGWPGDVVVGLIANCLGAWCYCNVFRWWYLLMRREAHPPLNVSCDATRR